MDSGAYSLKWEKCYVDCRRFGVVLEMIKKSNLNLEGKAWWTLARQKLCPTTSDDVLSLVWVAMIADFMESYEFDVA